MALKPARLQWPENADDRGGTLRSAEYGDIYFQPQQGPEESNYVFLEQNRLPERFFQSSRSGMQIAELGFGTGLNFLLTARLWQQAKAPGQLRYVSIEKHPLAKEDLKRVFSFWPELKPLADALLAQYPPPLEGFYHIRLLNNKVNLMLCLGDVADVLPEISGQFDAWFLDGFSPAKNPDMWDEKLFPLIAARTKQGGTLSTFSAAVALRRGLEEAGFTVEKAKGYGRKREMTVAQKPGAAPAEEPKRIAVLGAGLAGAATAFACAEKGHAVTVFDQHPAAAQETSGNPVGILYPKVTADLSPLGLYFQHGFFFTRNLVSSLNLPSWNPCGITELATSPEEAKRHASLHARGHWPLEFMSPAKTAYGEALEMPLGGCLSPPELCRRLLDHPHISTSFSHTLSSLARLNEYDAIVMALGYSTKSFPETSWLPLVSVRGQITFLKPTAQSSTLTHIICHDGALPPAVNGLHYAGATFHREAPDVPQLRAEDDAENLEKLNRYLPQFGFSAEHIAGGRAGYRTSAPDHMPILGRAPDYPAFVEAFAGLRSGKCGPADGPRVNKLHLAVGFGGQGLSGAPLAGEIIASLISDSALPVPQSLMPYLAPERFILRDLKRGKI